MGVGWAHHRLLEIYLISNFESSHVQAVNDNFPTPSSRREASSRVVLFFHVCVRGDGGRIFCVLY